MAQLLLYAGGHNRFTAKKFGQFLFGDYFRRLVVDSEKRMFYLIMNEYVEDKEAGTRTYFKEAFSKEYRDYFKEFWGKVPGIEIKVVKVTEVDIDEVEDEEEEQE